MRSVGAQMSEQLQFLMLFPQLITKLFVVAIILKRLKFQMLLLVMHSAFLEHHWLRMVINITLKVGNMKSLEDFLSKQVLIERR